MATVLDTLQKGTAYLEKRGVEEARLNMQLLLAHALKCDRMRVYLDFDRVLEESQLEKLRELTKRRGQGEPLQHLLGTVEFCGREFISDDRALIPRPETEELVERLSHELKDAPDGIRLLDVGTGSGVIGLSLAANLSEKGPVVVLSDVSSVALALAEENREGLGLAPDAFQLVESDLFAGIEGAFNLIVANLPYVAESERTALSREVRRDPDLALFGGGEQGTEVMERFLSECRAHLLPGGRIAMEFGEGQAESLRSAAEAAGLESVEIAIDLCGHERFLFAVNPGDPS